MLRKKIDEKEVTFSEIMLRLSPSGFKRFTQASRFEVIYDGGESNDIQFLVMPIWPPLK